MSDSREGTYRVHLQQKDRTSSEGWGCHPTVTPLIHNCFCLKELQGPNKQLKDSDAEILHPTNGQKLLTPVVELGKGRKKLRRRVKL